MEKIKKLSKADVAAFVFFLLFLLYGFTAFNDYGLSTDEDIERTTGLINIKEMFSLEEQVGSVDFGALPELSQWQDRYYGSVAQYIPLLIERIFGFQMEYHQIFQIRHLFTFLVFWLACISFYRLCVFLKFRRGEALLGVLFLVLSPRILADSFYNIKDSIFMSAMIFQLYAGLRFVERPSWPRGIVLAVICAVCVNVRVLGAEVLALCLAAAAIRGFRQKSSGRAIVLCLGVGLLSIAVYILITPVTWGGIWDAVAGILGTFSDYNSWTGYNYYRGEALRAWELPWHYIPVWILTTTPILYLALALAGAVGAVKDLMRRHFTVYKGIVALYVVIPLLYAMVRRPSLYNGWRHFYFLYPGIILAALYGWRLLWQYLPVFKRGERKLQVGQAAMVCAAAISLALTGRWIFANHPYECVYFNVLSRDYASANMEKDYWKMAQQSALVWIASNDPREEITVYGGSVDYLPNGEMKDRLQYVLWGTADYVIYSNVSDDEGERFDGLYLGQLSGDEDFLFDGFELYDEVYRIEADDMCICRIYKRTHNRLEGARLIYSEGQWQYDLNGINWKTTDDGEMLCLEGTFETAQPFDRIGIQSDKALLPLRIELSSDGENWTSYDGEAWTKFGDARAQLNIASETAGFIRLYYAKEDLQLSEEAQIDIGFYYETDTPALWRDPPVHIAGVEASAHSEYQGFAVDGDPDTRWDSGMAQQPGLTFEIEMDREYSLAGITLDYGEYEDDYPRSLGLYVSSDGKQWERAELAAGEFGYYQCDAEKVRYLRLTVEGESTWNWSICEIKIWIKSE